MNLSCAVPLPYRSTEGMPNADPKCRCGIAVTNPLLTNRQTSPKRQLFYSSLLLAQLPLSCYFSFIFFDIHTQEGHVQVHCNYNVIAVRELYANNQKSSKTPTMIVCKFMAVYSRIRYGSDALPTFT
jgi:hypothetical protein